ncbi:MAG: hypothetical protein AAFN77_10350 [Planctomycetota bacterium]
MNSLFKMILFLPFLGLMVVQSGMAQETDDTSSAAQQALEELEWVAMEPSGALAKFEMPVKPRYVERSFTPVKGRDPIKVRLHIATTNGGKASYIFSYHDLEERPKDSKAIAATLEGAMRGSLMTVSGKLLSEPQEIQYAGAPGRQFVYGYEQRIRNKDGDALTEQFFVIARVFLVRRRQYQLSVLMDSDVYEENLAGKYLNSFKLIKPEPDLPPVPRKK